MNMNTNSSNLTNAPHQVLPAAAKRRTNRGRGASRIKAGTKTQNRESAAVLATTSSKKNKNAEKENPNMNMFPTNDDTMLHMISFCGHVAVSKLLFVSHRFRKLVDARMKSIVDAAFCLGSPVTFKREEWCTEYTIELRPLQSFPGGDREHLVQLALDHCDLRSLFHVDFTGDKNVARAEVARRKRFIENAKDMLMEDDELIQTDFVAPDEPQPHFDFEDESEFEKPWTISLEQCGEITRKTEAIEVFNAEFSRDGMKRILSEELEHVIEVMGLDRSCFDPSCKTDQNPLLYSRHLVSTIFDRATSVIKKSSFVIEDGNSYCFYSIKNGITFIIEGDDGRKFELFGFRYSCYER